VQIGRIAAANGLTLVELRPAEGAGLEELFLELTSEAQRDHLTTTAPDTSYQGASA
jgi:ABC-2 type transport system ATP-binding protein